MTEFDKAWGSLARKIIEKGNKQDIQHVRAKWEDGTPAPAKYLVGEKLKFDNTEALVMESKFIPEKAPKIELDWIWFKKSNNVQTLRDMGSNIWDKWEIKDPDSPWYGTIGPAYGHQLGIKCRKFAKDKINKDHLDPNMDIDKLFFDHKDDDFVLLDQVDFLIQGLLTNPGSRRYVTSLWNINDLDEMALEPCVWNTTWTYRDGKLDLIVGIRSNDFCVGNPFNVYQYQVLQHVICKVVGLGVGTIQFDIANPHIYDRHFYEAMDQISLIENGMNNKHRFVSVYKPKLLIKNRNKTKIVQNFYEFNLLEDVSLVHYTPGPKRTFEVAE